ncbi:uncharacterized protein LOC116845114 isoform X3 [Odontomachus brunneus]|uniref:uncharacterized protein LOC116845114 isoform X3 n=1 Tax=Odontomachus brunneus TaxID=486640 RepID=UPI0013F268EE|nr:uncharacterized protein LOC116845114 isoform X3 [Odontomachus brunneus]
MTVLPVIPFFLGYIIQNQSNPTPSYIFHVRVDTLFINKSGTHDTENNAGLAFNLKCQPYMDQNLKCHIQKDIFYSPSTDFVHMVDNNDFTPSCLQFDRIRYRMSFDFKGVTSYQILTENVENKKTLLEMYRFIGDQLSVGADLKTRGFEFNTTEDTIIGKCPTLYKIHHDVTLNTSNFELTLIARQKYRLNKNESLHISKQRRVNECHPQNGYILGRILWTDLITSKVTAKLKESGTLMMFAQNDFYTKTINTFDLYNEQDKRVGYVYETMNVRLDFIEG